MLARIVASRVIARAAVAGSVLGLVTLAALVTWANASTYRATTQVRSMDRVSDTWDQVFQQVSLEEDAAREYAAARSDDTRQPLGNVVGSAEPYLTWLMAHGGHGSAGAAIVRDTYRGFTATLREMLAQGGQNQELVTLEAGQAQLAAASLRKQVTSNVERTRILKEEFLDQVDANTARLRIAGTVVSGLDLVLLLLCSLVLLGYQRRIERESATNRRQALHDTLTGLGNRVLLEDRMTAAIWDADRHPGHEVGLLLIDLDGFKEVNDTLGHHAGDLLLRQVSTHLCNSVREVDTVVRLGGDEFAVLLPHLASQDDALTIAHRVLASVRQPVDVNGLTIEVSGSVGVSRYPSQSDGAEQLLQHADIAMYTAKRGRLGVFAYEPTSGENGTTRLTLLGDLRRALRAGEIVLHYQPKAVGETQRFYGVEALARWQHPERGLLPPGEFIPVAERNGLMGELTEYVLGAALDQCRRWRLAGYRVPIAVNVGAQCLHDPGFPGQVAGLLMDKQVDADLLTLEITESAIITDPARAMRVLDKIRGLGIGLSIDDFGVGYASMAYLRTMPVQELKIDRSFVSQMETDASSKAIVRAVIDLAHDMGLRVVAEGVEDEHTWTALVRLGCDIMQGYHLSRPLPVDHLDPWLDEQFNGTFSHAAHE